MPTGMGWLATPHEGTPVEARGAAKLGGLGLSRGFCPAPGGACGGGNHAAGAAYTIGRLSTARRPGGRTARAPQKACTGFPPTCARRVETWLAASLTWHSRNNRRAAG